MPSAPGSRRSLTRSQPKLAAGTGSKHRQPTAPLCRALYVFMDSPELAAGGHDEIRSPRGRRKAISPVAECETRKEACKYHTEEADVRREDGLAVVQALVLPLAARSAHLPPDWSLFVNTSSQSRLPAEPPLSRLSSPRRAGGAIPGWSTNKRTADGSRIWPTILLR